MQGYSNERGLSGTSHPDGDYAYAHMLVDALLLHLHIINIGAVDDWDGSHPSMIFIDRGYTYIQCGT